MGHQIGRLCDCDDCGLFSEWARQAVAAWPALTDDQIGIIATILRNQARGA